MGWAGEHGLSVRWRPGDNWAIVEGEAEGCRLPHSVSPCTTSEAAAGRCSTPPRSSLRCPRHCVGSVTGLGRILGYTPHHESRPSDLPTDVPDQGLSPAALRNVYNVTPLTDQGYTGKGQTIVVFAFDGFDQADLDMLRDDMSTCRSSRPRSWATCPPNARGETTMDLQMAHAMAPDARKVLVNARPTVSGDGAYVKIAQMMESADRDFPGAVWSFSIGWGCDKLLTAADLTPVRSALVRAHSHGTTAFNASGDLAGLECKGGQDWSAPPGPDDIGLDAVASLPEMTDVGGTTLSTDSRGGWLAEQAWFDVPLSHGHRRRRLGPVRSSRVAAARCCPVATSERRLTPDVAAVADPFTGVKIVFDQQVLVGGGTSQAAPIWAGMAAVMNQYLLDNGGRRSAISIPLLYRTVAEGARLPGFRDVTLGGNAVDSAGPGYDLVTGLGTPDVDNLVRNLLVRPGGDA